jgi:hypothetical protein
VVPHPAVCARLDLHAHLSTSHSTPFTPEQVRMNVC